MITELKAKDEKIFDRNMNQETKNIIGCKAVAGEPVLKIAEQFNVDRSFVYREKTRVLRALKASEEPKIEKTITITKSLIERIIIGCMLFCKGSTEDCQRFLLLVLCIKVSIGKISMVMNESAKKAQMWNETIRLDSIKIGANDEIFQGSKPILVGVDTKTTYVYLFQAAASRDANTWGYFLLDTSQKQGLMLEQAVSDAGKGIIRGTKDAFGEDILYQSDVFHVLYEFGKGMKAMELYAYACIHNYEKLTKSHSKKAISQDDLDATKYKETVAIQDYQLVCIAYEWIKELLEKGGYFYEDRVNLFRYILENLNFKGYSNNYLKKSIRFMKNNIEGMLQFVRIAESKLTIFAAFEGVDTEIIKKMWLQEAYSTHNPTYNYLEAEIGNALGSKYLEIKQKYDELKSNIVRASSIVECINSLIRPYINLKRALPEGFMHLLQMYFNTRKYRRSRIENRRGKSPYELLTGKRCDNLLDVLCPAG